MTAKEEMVYEAINGLTMLLLGASFLSEIIAISKTDEMNIEDIANHR
jgi:hypothetical protein